ncbi:MAG: type II secretion system protein J [Candidatus Bipolaricaulia bacterium]
MKRSLPMLRRSRAEPEHGERGFTLLELMLSVAIFSILALGLYEFLIRSGIQTWERNLIRNKLIRNGNYDVELLVRDLREARNLKMGDDDGSVQSPFTTTFEVTHEIEVANGVGPDGAGWVEVLGGMGTEGANYDRTWCLEYDDPPGRFDVYSFVEDASQAGGCDSGTAEGWILINQTFDSGGLRFVVRSGTQTFGDGDRFAISPQTTFRTSDTTPQTGSVRFRIRDTGVPLLLKIQENSGGNGNPIMEESILKSIAFIQYNKRIEIQLLLAENGQTVSMWTLVVPRIWASQI